MAITRLNISIGIPGTDDPRGGGWKHSQNISVRRKNLEVNKIREKHEYPINIKQIQHKN